MVFGTSRVCFRAGVRRMASGPWIRTLARKGGNVGGIHQVCGSGECAARHQSRSPVLAGGRRELLETSDASSHQRSDIQCHYIQDKQAITHAMNMRIDAVDRDPFSSPGRKADGRHTTVQSGRLSKGAANWLCSNPFALRRSACRVRSDSWRLIEVFLRLLTYSENRSRVPAEVQYVRSR